MATSLSFSRRLLPALYQQVGRAPVLASANRAAMIPSSCIARSAAATINPERARAVMPSLLGAHPTRCHTSNAAPDAAKVKVVFEDKHGTVTEVEARVGQHILEVAHDNEIDLEGACEASLACSTCHVILDDDSFDLLPEATDKEDDLLDMAFGLTDTSRLGCQCYLTEELDGIKCKLPEATRNFYVDGHKPTPH